jgi:glycosyltransferase involved in cell wall biosynthesis
LQETTSTESAIPKVSILIPTHNRPHYFEIALKSALSQKYRNLEIVVSDNSDDDRTQDRISAYQATYENLVYLRTRKTDATQNFSNALRVSTGEYISYLMDDDVFHPEKVVRMMAYFIANPSVGLVTSHRKLINADGVELPQVPGTEKLFEKDTLITGEAFGKFILERGSNCVGEPTTAIVRRKDLDQGFGWFCGRRYKLLSDVATWLSILAKCDCVYIAESLSYFRIHNEQDQKKSSYVQLNASVEWFNLTLSALRNKIFLEPSPTFKSQLSDKLNSFKYYISLHSDHKQFPQELRTSIAAVIQEAEDLIHTNKDA